jgi:SAM-dependent methyltransferase
MSSLARAHREGSPGPAPIEAPREDEAARLERLWGGEFGSAYSERNAEAGTGRKAFWDTLLTRYSPRRVLEIGCNTGANLQWIAPHLEPGNAYGIDVNHEALTVLRDRVPRVSAVASNARELPFRDRWFDLSLTMGVLIHQPESTLPVVMAEAVRVSNRYAVSTSRRGPSKYPTEVSRAPSSSATTGDSIGNRSLNCGWLTKASSGARKAGTM